MKEKKPITDICQRCGHHGKPGENCYCWINKNSNWIYLNRDEMLKNKETICGQSVCP